METAPVLSVSFNRLSEILRPLEDSEQDIVLDMLQDGVASFGSNSFTLVKKDYLIAELECVRDEFERVNPEHFNKAIARITAPFIDLES